MSSRVTGVAHYVPGSLALHISCQDCWGCTTCARVAGVAQCILGLLGSQIMCQGHGLHRVCQGHWGCTGCARVARARTDYFLNVLRSGRIVEEEH